MNKLFFTTCTLFVAAVLTCPVASGATLTERLVSQDEVTRETALREFDNLDSKDKERLIPDLIQALKETKWRLLEYVRRSDEPVMAALEYYGNRWSRPVPGIILALTKMGPAAVPAVSQVLRKDKRDSIRRKAAVTLLSMGPQAEGAVTELREAAANDRHKIVRLLAARAICKIGPTAQEALSNLKPALEHQNTDVRYIAVTVLGDLGQAAMPTLLRVITDAHEDIKVRQAAIGSLAKNGPVAVPHLIQALGDKDSGVRSQAAASLAAINPPPKDAVPALIEALSDKESSGVSQMAAYTLSRMGPAAKDALPLLIHYGDPSVRASAVEALGQLGAKEHGSEIVPLLNDNNNRVRYHAVLALARLGAKEHAEEIAELLNDHNAQVRAIAAWALQQLRATEKIRDIERDIDK